LKLYTLTRLVQATALRRTTLQSNALYTANDLATDGSDIPQQEVAYIAHQPSAAAQTLSCSLSNCSYTEHQQHEPQI